MFTVELHASLELTRTDTAPQPCRACGTLTHDVWALVQSDAERLYYAEYRACTHRCAENLAQETEVYA